MMPDCSICHIPITRRKGEGIKQFSNRKTCSNYQCVVKQRTKTNMERYGRPGRGDPDNEFWYVPIQPDTFNNDFAQHNLNLRAVYQTPLSRPNQTHLETKSSMADL